jgi:hypothetical protein
MVSRKYIPVTQIERSLVGDKVFDFVDPTVLLQVSGDGGVKFPELTQAERDLVWPPGSFPNLAWKGIMINNSTTNTIQYNDGVTWSDMGGSAPSSVAAFYQQYVDDAAYVVANGAAVNGSVYYNTTFDAVREYSNGAWHNIFVPQVWQNSTDYNVEQTVWVGAKNYRCNTLHTSNPAGVITDDIANWDFIGYYTLNEMDDVDVTGQAANDILVWDGAKYVVAAKDDVVAAMVYPELGATPAVPAAGFVKYYAKDDKRFYMLDSTGRETLLEVPLNVIDYASLDPSGWTINVWEEVIAATSALTRRVQIFDAAGITMEWGVGAAASEVGKWVSGEGSNESIDIEIPAGSRLAVRALSAGSYAGTVSTNLLG